MRVLFVCGSLSPGENGVGDYTRCLAAEIIRQKHSAAIMALIDRSPQHASVDLDWAEQVSGGTRVETVRISREASWRRRRGLLAEVVRSYEPDWVSLQFVPYAFDRRGIPWQLFWMVASLVGETAARWHIMFHECWEDGRLVGGLKGRLQREIAVRLTKTLSAVVNTQAERHLHLLGRYGIDGTLLPLFSNIPRAPKEGVLSACLKDPERCYKVLQFGRFSRSRRVVRAVLEQLERTAAANDRHLVLVLAGNSGASGDVIKFLARRQGVAVIDLGSLPDYKLSSLMQECDVGVSRVPLELISKSGSVTAMLHHGLPVWVPPTESAVGTESPVLVRGSAADLDEVAAVFLSLLSTATWEPNKPLAASRVCIDPLRRQTQ